MNISESEYEQLQQNNLERNYERFEGERLSLDSEEGLNIEIHHRDTGKTVFYVVMDDIPIAYCIGTITRQHGRQRFVIASTFITRQSRGQGIGTELYKSIIASGTTLVSDWELSAGGQALWASLRRDMPQRSIIQIGDIFVGRLPKGCL